MTLQTKLRPYTGAANTQRKSPKSIVQGHRPWTYVILNPCCRKTNDQNRQTLFYEIQWPAELNSNDKLYHMNLLEKTPPLIKALQ